MASNSNTILQHHKRYEYCHTRLNYRAGRHLSAVKVYTVANESRHILVFGVPKINLQSELKKELLKYGTIELITNITNEIVKEQIKMELFTDCFRVTYNRIQDARKAKKFVDAKNFYGGVLHISYGLEHESVMDVKNKLLQRLSEVKFRLNVNANAIPKSLSNNIRLDDCNKRKCDDQHSESSKRLKM